MSTMHRTIDPQLPLSILFLAIAEAQMAEKQRRAAQAEQDEILAHHERSQVEEPERWDGLL